MPISTSVNQRCARCSRIAKALNANTLCAKRPSHWAGPRIASSSLTAISDSRELPPPTGRAFNGWLPRSAWDEPESCWGWRYRDWRATRPTGIGCWRSVLTDALILDEDGIYDPAHFNDRLLLL